ncbi:MAG TPA: hypothetical protein VLG68_04755 [Gammaproteobacteria bacterium]|nr:hypothetical protein [Gammaproteobacteria bacterium]
MRRVIWGFVIAPLAVLFVDALFTGSFSIALFSCIEAYLAILVFGIPIFALFSQLKWLRWWHIMLAGTIVSMAMGWFMDSPAIVPNSYVIEMDGTSDLFSGAALGCAMALVFWFVGVFQNKEYPYVSRALPLSPLVITLVLIGISLYVVIATKRPLVQGEITKLLNPVSDKPMAEVELDSGKTVDARLLCYRSYTVGEKVTLSHRSKHPLIPEMYWITTGESKESNQQVMDCIQEGSRWYKGEATSDDYPKS